MKDVLLQIVGSKTKMADLVEKVLRDAAEKESKFKTTEVEKDIDLDIDEGNLLACDKNPIDIKSFKLVKFSISPSLWSEFSLNE